MSATTVRPTARERQRRRRLGVALLAVVVLSTWVGGAWLLRDQVEVTWPAGVSCVGAEASHGDHPTVVVAVQPSMSCDLTVRVHNAGWAPVSLDEIVLPFMGPGGGPVVQVESFEGRPPRPDRLPGPPVDAVFDVSDWLGPGAERMLTVSLTYRPDGGSAAGLMTLSEFPSVRVSALGLGGTRAGQETIGFRVDE